MVPLPKGFALEKSLNSRNKFFLENKKEYDVSWLLGEEEELVPSGCSGFFDGGRTNVGGLKLKVMGIFS